MANKYSKARAKYQKMYAEKAIEFLDLSVDESLSEEEQEGFYQLHLAAVRAFDTAKIDLIAADRIFHSIIH